MGKRTLANVADTQEIAARVGKIQTSSQRRWGKMTVQEMVCHLSDSFLMVMGAIHATPAKRSELPAPMPRSFLKWVALQVPMQWPQGIQTRPELDPKRRGTRPGVFEADLQQLRQLLEQFTRQPRDYQFAPHPIFGVMNESEWMRWGYLHMDHHLRQFGV